MTRSLAWVCLAAALSVAACTSKPDSSATPPAQPAAQPATPPPAGSPGDDLRARADAGREKAGEARADADRLRDAAGAGAATSTPASQAVPQEAAPTPAAPEPAPQATGQPTYRSLPGGDMRAGGATARSRADRLRSRADRLRMRAGGAPVEDAPAPPPPAAAAQARPRSAAAPTPTPAAAASAPAAPAPQRTAPAPGPAPAAAPAPARNVGRPVDPNELGAVLPSMAPPWSGSRIQANMLASPVVCSQARITFRQGESYVRIEIVDTVGNDAAISYLKSQSRKGTRSLGKDGYERTATFAGYPSWETWQNAQQHGSLNILVGNRFFVSYIGHGIESAQVLTGLAQRTDLRRLEALK